MTWQVENSMQYISRYASPLGGILLAADDAGLFGLWFEGQKYFARCLQPPFEERLTAPLAAARRWLDAYFSGGRPTLDVPLHLIGTPFQKDVWQALCEIPYGRTATYGEVAQTVASHRCAPVSARAVGNAVGRNAISLIVPCHRVVGANGSLTGYAGGIDKKIWLLEHEGVCLDSLFRPKHSTAP